MSGFAVDILEKVETIVTSSSASEVLSYNGFRNYLLIQNKGSDGTGTVGAPIKATFGEASILIPVGGSYEPEGGIRDIVTVQAITGTQSIAVLGGR